jgi:hypothetical protein
MSCWLLTQTRSGRTLIRCGIWSLRCCHAHKRWCSFSQLTRTYQNILKAFAIDCFAFEKGKKTGSLFCCYKYDVLCSTSTMTNKRQKKIMHIDLKNYKAWGNVCDQNYADWLQKETKWLIQLLLHFTFKSTEQKSDWKSSLKYNC